MFSSVCDFDADFFSYSVNSISVYLIVYIYLPVMWADLQRVVVVTCKNEEGLSKAVRWPFRRVSLNYKPSKICLRNMAISISHSV